MKISKIKFNLRLIKDILIESWRGKSIYRIMLNNSIKRYSNITGEILDLGSGDGKNSYYRFINFKKPYKIKYTDLYKNSDDPNFMKQDLEKKFSLDNDIFDSIICFNVLEHIYNHNNLVSESFRVLKKDGKMIGGVPFLLNYHADPNDYWRYTWQALEKIAHKHSFKVEKIVSLGSGPFVASWMQTELVWPKFIKPFFILFLLFLDYIILKLRPKIIYKYPLGYFFIFSK